jgi:hypothetical protein
MSAPTRTLKIKYGGTTLGGGDYLLHMPYFIDISYRRLTIECHVVISESSLSTLKTKSDALEAQFRTIRQNIQIDMSGNQTDYTEAAATAFNITPSITKVQDTKFTGLSREYICRIEADLPSDAVGDNGLKESTASLDLNPNGQKVLTISGIYTAQPGPPVVKARAQYLDKIEAFSDAQKTLVDAGAEWDTLVDTSSNDTKDFECSFQRVFQEIIVSQSTLASPLDFTGISDDNLIVVAKDTNPGDSLSAEITDVSRPIDVTVGYSASIDIKLITDLNAVWKDTIRPYMIAEGKKAAGGDFIAVISSDPGFNISKNLVDANLVMRVYTSAELIGSFIGTARRESKGIRFVPVHGTNPHSKIILPAAAIMMQVKTYRFLIFGNETLARSKALTLIESPSYAEHQEGRSPQTLPAQGGAIDPLAVPDFGADGGDFIEFDREEPEVRTIRIGKPATAAAASGAAGVSENVEVTTYSEKITSLYVARPAQASVFNL